MNGLPKKKLSNKKLNPDKAKPFVRRGRKAAGLIKEKMAELPKDETSGSSAFFILISPDWMKRPKSGDKGCKVKSIETFYLKI